MTGELFRPLLQIATFCQTALQEANGSLSVIRVIDRVPVHNVTPELPPTPINLTLVVVLKSGFMRGKGVVGIRQNSPSKKQTPMLQMPVLFEGDDRGVGLVIPMTLVLDEEGPYWFDILVNDELITQVPLRLMYQQLPFQFGSQPSAM